MNCSNQLGAVRRTWKIRMGQKMKLPLSQISGLIPLSDVSISRRASKKAEAEIDAVVQKIEKTQQELGIEKLNSPWLPPLKDGLHRSEYKEKRDGVFPIGLIDEPEKQSQTVY